MIVCGISTGFPVLFPTPAQITHVLLTRAPLYSGSCPPFLARLACVRHAASVRSEPGSNSPVETGDVPAPEGTRTRLSSAAHSTNLLRPRESFALSVTAFGTFSALGQCGKGALLFSFQRPDCFRGRPALIGQGRRGVKRASHWPA